MSAAGPLTLQELSVNADTPARQLMPGGDFMHCKNLGEPPFRLLAKLM